MTSVLAKIVFIYTKVYTSLYLKVKRVFDIGQLNNEIRIWRSRKEDIKRKVYTDYKITLDDLGLDAESRIVLEEAHRQSREVTIAEIDQDGFFMSYFGSIGNLPTVSRELFFKRNRFDIRLVILDGDVCIRKDYKGNKMAFLSEVKALYLLRLSGCNVPSIIDVDFDNLVLYLSFILGSVIREELAKKGAILRDRDVIDFFANNKLTKREKVPARIEQGREKITSVVDSVFVEYLRAELRKIHSARFTWNDIKYGNIIIEKKTGRPYLIDFEKARYYPHLSETAFISLRDKNIESLNLLFCTDYLSRKRLEDRIKEIKKSDVYAPIYFGAGLWLGNIWSLPADYGCWDHRLQRNLPSPIGKRILKLGVNNAYISVQLLRRGAQEVIGVELSEEQINIGQLVLEGFEWVDNKKYNFKYIHGDIKNILKMNLGKFDMVLALCCIDYLSDEEIATVAGNISMITDIFLLQCNIAILNRRNPRGYKKGFVNYARNIMKDNGFSDVQVIAPRGYLHPLVIGKKGVEVLN